jgi:hypothetical protein
MDIFGEITPTLDDDNYDLVYLKKHEDCGLISHYVEPNFGHHTKNNLSAKQSWDTFHNLFGAMTIDLKLSSQSQNGRLC